MLKALCVVLLLLIKTTVVYGTEETIVSSVNSVDDKSEFFYLGISDPIIDTLLAYEQAVQRALAFYALSTSVDFSSVYEYYYLDAVVDENDHDNQKSHWIAEFDAEVKGVSYKVKEQYRTNFNETIVLLSITNNADSKVDVNVSGMFMYHYDYDNNQVIYGEKQILTIQTGDSPNILEWNSTVDNRKYLKKSITNGELNVLKHVINIYEDYGTVNDEMVFCENKFGLWNSFIDTFFQAMSLFESKYVVVKNTYRQITQESNGAYEDKNQNIARMVMKTNTSCTLNKFSLKNNILYANWEIIEK